MEDIGRGVNFRKAITPLLIVIVVLVWGYFGSVMVFSGDRQTSEETSTVPNRPDTDTGGSTGGLQTSPETSSTTMGILVVPYFDVPSSEWDTIYQQAELYPGTIKYVIINPCSGPCDDALSTDWQDVISKLQSRGIKTLGYVYNNAQSIASIDYYMKAPAVRTDGIFFDNEGDTDDTDHFKQYADYVHSLGGIVYINPGFNHSHVTSYVTGGLADVANFYEFGVEKSHYISLSCQVPPSRASIILGNVSTASEMRATLEEVASTGIGIIYVYGDAYEYDTLPPYFAEMVKKASSTYVNDLQKNCKE